MVRNPGGMLLALLAAALVGLGGCAGSDSDGRIDGYGGYYDALTPYGGWYRVAPYGTVWVPLDIDPGWRPYTFGRWAYTDWGWMWISQDPWGGLPYHYGRWAYDSFYGWIWVPDDVWGPAWVSWRYGGGWVGWAPLPPGAAWRPGVGLALSVYNIDRSIDPQSWCFVPVRDFTSTRIRTAVLPPSRSVTPLSVTRNVTRYRVVDSRPAERGLLPGLIERETGRTIPKYQLVEAKGAGARGDVVRGRRIEVYRPAISKEVLDRVPPGRPPRALIEKQRAAARRLEGTLERERAALAREHERELRQTERQRINRTRIEEIQRRQEAEVRAQREREERERRMIEERRRILEEREWGRAGERQRDPDQGRGRGRGRGNPGND